ncbi:MAG: response regulator transcription factor [Candidatus Solibacter usitatus]|nr:response regulator transcription factor [Candidatus Solibacter usitatus]
MEQVEDISLVGSGTPSTNLVGQIVQLRPKVALVENSGGLRNTFRFLTDLKVAAPDTWSILWTPEIPEVEAFRALQVGARGVLKRELPTTVVLDCIRSIAAGKVWLDQAMPGTVTTLLGQRQALRLTPRERQILQCLCSGMRNKEIGQELRITAGTVKVHLMHVFEKTGVKDRVELAVEGRKLLGLHTGGPET